MCDTFTFREKSSTSRLWFGKNSDREPNEAHEVVFTKGTAYPNNETVKCTYIEIPQVKETYDVLLCKPVWMWGAEMGINSHGVSIGNEAVFTRGKTPREPALTGMDLLRLGLERSTSAREALDWMILLLEKFGQGGNCGYNHPFYYNNSFLITDRKESWILETIEKNWAAKRFESTAAISNSLTLKGNWDEASRGFLNAQDLAAENSDPLVTLFSQAVRRRECVLDGLAGVKVSDDIKAAFKVLRSHGGHVEIPVDSLTANTVCMHAGFGPIRIDQTTGSMVVDYSGEVPVVWVTGTSAPCLSVFHPVLLSDYSVDTVISSQDEWLDNEIFHRKMLLLPEELLSEFSLGRDKIESELIDKMGDTARCKPDELMKITTDCNENRKAFLKNWLKKISTLKGLRGHILYRAAWNKFNREANIRITL